MSITVHKYPIDSSTKSIGVSGLIKPLSVDVQNGHAMLWCLVDDEPPAFVKDLKVEMLVTGGIARGPAKHAHNFVGTVLFDNGKFVQHVFVERD